MDEDRLERAIDENTAALQDLRAVIADSAARQERASGLLGEKVDRLGFQIERLGVDVRDLRRTFRGGNGPSPEPA